MPYNAHPRLAQLFIDGGAIVQNYQFYTRQTNAHIAACLKANAYGMGAKEIAPLLYTQGCRQFFVASSAEGQNIRHALGVHDKKATRIYVLNGALCMPNKLANQEINTFLHCHLSPVINTYAQAKFWHTTTHHIPTAPSCALHIETGMNRIGLDTQDYHALRTSSWAGALKVNLLVSHLSAAATPNHPFNAQQRQCFIARTSLWQDIYAPAKLSLASTAGLALGSDYHFDTIRLGIGLFGFNGLDKNVCPNLRPVLSLQAPILQVKHLQQGESVGYDQSFIATRPMKVAFVAVGYADGLSYDAKPTLTQKKPAHNPTAPIGASVLGRGTDIAPIIGKVSMDLTCLDVSHYDNVQEGDIAIFSQQNLMAQAKNSGKIPNALLTGFGGLHTGKITRIYI